jgi:hypothetical protein
VGVDPAGGLRLGASGGFGEEVGRGRTVGHLLSLPEGRRGPGSAIWIQRQIGLLTFAISLGLLKCYRFPDLRSQLE